MLNRKINRYLLDWKERETRKPLVIRGARQVGKTYIVQSFAEKHFSDYIYLNLDKEVDKRQFADVVSIEDFIEKVQILLKKNVVPKKTLLFIDEIQNSPNLVKLLRYFYEEMPKLHVIAAGSLLELMISEKKISMPVGRIEYAYMYPLDFFEFLEALGEDALLSILQTVTLDDRVDNVLHNHAMKYLNTYMLVGGMPEVVDTYVRNSDLLILEGLYEGLFETYLEDATKYSSSQKEKYLRAIIESAPLHSGELYNYANFGAYSYGSREMGDAFGQLEKTMLINEVEATDTKSSPLVSNAKRPKKLIFLDIGLVNYKSKNLTKSFQDQSISNNFRGRIAEQFVGQNLLSYYNHKKFGLNYWAKKKEEGESEVDFAFNVGSDVFGIEVKSGSTGKLKSLYNFADVVQNSHLVRIHSGHLKKETIEYHNKTYELCSIPAYLTPRLLDLLNF
jgi:hypothetical protein